MLDNLSPQHMVEKFQAVTSELMVSTFPVKKIIISTDDKPWFNEELRKLKRLRLREYGRNDCYLAPRLSAVDVRRRIIKAKKPNGIIVQRW